MILALAQPRCALARNDDKNKNDNDDDNNYNDNDDNDGSNDNNDDNDPPK